MTFEHLPAANRERATALLNLLKAKPDLVSWDDTGQVKLEGETIPQTNISDLVTDAVNQRPRKTFVPTGLKEFFICFIEDECAKRNCEKRSAMESNG